jgi:hypothetical protein
MKLFHRACPIRIQLVRPVACSGERGQFRYHRPSKKKYGADVLSRWLVRVGCLDGALRCKLDHPSRRARLGLESPPSTRCGSPGTFGCASRCRSALDRLPVMERLQVWWRPYRYRPRPGPSRCPRAHRAPLEAHLKVIKGPIQALQTIIQQAEQAADAPPGRGSIVSVRRDRHNGRTLRRDALGTRWPVYDCPGALFSFGGRQHIPPTRR